MKSSKKVLAFALAAAMVVTAVPATNAQAASTAKLSAKKATVYSEGYKTVTVKTPKSWKSVKVTATSNKKSVATVKKTAAKKIKVTGVKPGTAKVTVKVTYKTSTKKSAKAKTKKLTYTLKVAKVGVALSGDSVVAIGSTTKLTNTKKNSSRAKITYTSSDDSIATVAADGTVTGVKAGKATITAKITVGKDSATTTKDVEVKNYVLSTVAQNKLTELTATVTGNTKNLKPTDFVVKNETTNVVYPVSKVSVDSKDASKVTLTLFSELKDAATYDVTLDGITKTFVASDGKVASVAPNTLGHFEGATAAIRIHHNDGSFLDYGQYRLVVGQDAHSAFRGRNGDGLRRTVPYGVVGGDDVHLHCQSGHHAPYSFCMSCHFFSRSSMPPIPENACSGTSSYTPSQMRVNASMVSSAGT